MINFKNNFKKIFYIFFCLPAMSFASDFSFSFPGFVNGYVENQNGEKAGIFDLDIWEEIEGYDLYLSTENGSRITLNEIEDGNYKIFLQAYEEIGEYETSILFVNDLGDVNYYSQNHYLKTGRNIDLLNFSIENGELVLGKEFSPVDGVKIDYRSGQEFLLWNEVAGAIAYDIFKKMPGEEIQNLYSISGTETQLMVTTPKSSEFYISAVFSRESGVKEKSVLHYGSLGTYAPGKDDDEDSISDYWEDVIGTDKNNPDSDGDGVGDLEEILGGTDPTVADVWEEIVLFFKRLFS